MSNINSGFQITLGADGQMKMDSFEKPKVNYPDEVIKEIKDNCDNAFTDLRRGDNKAVFDTNESIFLNRELTRMIRKVLMKWYPDYTSKQLFSVNTENYYPGIQSLEYAMTDWSAKAKVAVSTNTTKRYARVSEDQTPVPVRYVELFARYNWYDLQAALLNGKPLPSKLLDATRDGIEKTLNELVYGIHQENDDGVYTDYGTAGLFNSLTKLITVSDDATNLANDNMLTNSAADNLTMLLNAIGVPMNFTNKAAANPNTIALPIPQASLIMKQPLGDGYQETVASQILKTTSIRRIVACPEFKNVGRNSITDAMLVFNDSPDIAEIMEVMPYSVKPTQQDGFNYDIPTHAGTAGLFIYRKAMALIKNVGA